MKLTVNEKLFLKEIIKNPSMKNSEIAIKLGITSQAVGKIRRQIDSKGIIKSQEIITDYDKLGISVHAIALIKILPAAHHRFSEDEINKILNPINAIRVYAIPETDVTHMIIYAFKDIKEFDHYVRHFIAEFGEFVEIKHSYVFSPESIMKSSPKDLLLNMLSRDETSHLQD